MWLAKRRWMSVESHQRASSTRLRSSFSAGPCRPECPRGLRISASAPGLPWPMKCRMSGLKLSRSFGGTPASFGPGLACSAGPAASLNVMFSSTRTSTLFGSASRVMPAMTSRVMLESMLGKLPGCEKTTRIRIGAPSLSSKLGGLSRDEARQNQFVLPAGEEKPSLDFLSVDEGSGGMKRNSHGNLASRAAFSCSSSVNRKRSSPALCRENCT